MASFLTDYLDSLDEKWNEIDIILELAKHYKDNDNNLYNALCRSATVLMVGHLEGFTRDLVKSIINDISDNCDFIEMPSIIKRIYTFKYLGLVNGEIEFSKQDNKRIEVLKNKFEELNPDIEYEPFLYSDKNPKPNLIKKAYKNLGIENIFAHLHESKYEDIFEGLPLDSFKEIILEKKEEIKTTTSNYPYTSSLDNSNLKSKTLQKNRTTLWEDFLSNIVEKRNKIAHGNNFNNSDDVDELEYNKNKIVYLQLAIVEVVASKI